MSKILAKMGKRKEKNRHENKPKTLMEILKNQKYYAAKPNFQRKYTFFIDVKITIYDLFLILLSLITILLGVVTVVFQISGTEYSLNLSRGLCWIMTITSFFSILIIGAIYHCQFARYRYCCLPKSTFWEYLIDDYHFIKFVSEIIIHIIYPYPYLEEYSHIFSVLTFLRMYRVSHLLLQLSDIYQLRYRINVYMAFFKQSIPKFTSRYVFRLLLNTKSFSTYAFVFIITYLSTCYLAYTSLNSSKNEGFDFATCLYWSMQTSTTLGYGDVQLNSGHVYELLLTIIIAFFGLIINSLLTAIMVMKLSPNEIDERAIEICDGLELIEQLKLHAAKAIQLRYKIYFHEKQRVKYQNIVVDETSKYLEYEINRIEADKVSTDASEEYHETMQKLTTTRRKLNDTFQKFLMYALSNQINVLQDQWDKRNEEYKVMVQKISIIYTNLCILCNVFNLDIDNTPESHELKGNE
ncbi:hypothetical protein TRFO_16444 [Tritrichomonas foetus]|uniref:Potassium channel domain-containing protein n=1 Tax=Tritrichomonas foetus TaxID=1144522 RepID=A0A1J4KQH5_9EUKA|nr:hypothetical protein TRFO_16444 [Tritrichomonas foetus]|eukprot:OHT13362.1 hypothetical protein TRFO_16444 [Tritrichomonas foetus]